MRVGWTEITTVAELIWSGEVDNSVESEMLIPIEGID